MKKNILCSFLVALSFNVAVASHLRGGHITITQLFKTRWKCRITITVYTNTKSGAFFGGINPTDGDLLNFGDGSSPVLVPEIGAVTTPVGSTYVILDAVRGIARATYTIDHDYANPGYYIVSYRELNRNGGVINFDQSDGSPFYLESSFKLDPLADKAYASPTFLAEPIFHASTESDFSYSIAAQDSNDYLLLYSLTTPNMDKNQNVVNYKLPASFKINQFNGLISWDTEFFGNYLVGEYTFSVKVHQIKDSERIGYVIRDFQIILEETDFNGIISDSPNLDENNRIYLPKGDTFSFKVFAQDSDAPSLEVFSELSSHPNLFSFALHDSTQDNRNIKVGVVTVTSSEEILRDNPYAIVVRATYQNGGNKFQKDLGYLFYTKDIEIPGLSTVVATEQEELLMNVYPNPIKDFLKIEDGTARNKSLKILLLNGETILEKKNFNDDVIDLRSLPKGVYILQVYAKDSNPKTFRIIKSE